MGNAVKLVVLLVAAVGMLAGLVGAAPTDYATDASKSSTAANESMPNTDSITRLDLYGQSADLKREVPPPDGGINDIANWKEWGYFRGRFQTYGFTCDGIGYDLALAPGLPNAKHRNFQCWETPTSTTAPSITDVTFDVSTYEGAVGPLNLACAIEYMYATPGFTWCYDEFYPQICCWYAFTAATLPQSASLEDAESKPA